MIAGLSKYLALHRQIGQQFSGPHRLAALANQTDAGAIQAHHAYVAKRAADDGDPLASLVVDSNDPGYSDDSVSVADVHQAIGTMSDDQLGWTRRMCASALSGGGDMISDDAAADQQANVDAMDDLQRKVFRAGMMGDRDVATAAVSHAIDRQLPNPDVFPDHMPDTPPAYLSVAEDADPDSDGTAGLDADEEPED